MEKDSESTLSGQIDDIAVEALITGFKDGLSATVAASDHFLSFEEVVRIYRRGIYSGMALRVEQPVEERKEERPSLPVEPETEAVEVSHRAKEPKEKKETRKGEGDRQKHRMETLLQRYGTVSPVWIGKIKRGEATLEQLMAEAKAKSHPNSSAPEPVEQSAHTGDMR